MEDDYKDLAVKIGVLESSIQELKNNGHQILKKLDRLEDHNKENEITHEKIEFMVNTLWERAGLNRNGNNNSKNNAKPQETFNQGMNRVIAAIALWLASLVVSTVLVAYLQNKVIP